MYNKTLRCAQKIASYVRWNCKDTGLPCTREHCSLERQTFSWSSHLITQQAQWSNHRMYRNFVELVGFLWARKHLAIPGWKSSPNNSLYMLRLSIVVRYIKNKNPEYFRVQPKLGNYIYKILVWFDCRGFVLLWYSIICRYRSIIYSSLLLELWWFEIMKTDLFGLFSANKSMTWINGIAKGA